MTQLSVGTEVIYCHGDQEHRAQICNVDAAGQVHLSVHDKTGAILFGSTTAKLAQVPADRITDGYFWVR